MYAQTWGKLGVGTHGLDGFGDGGPYLMCADKYGNLYVTGDVWNMSVDSNFSYTGVYKWNGSVWSNLGIDLARADAGGTGGLCVDSSGNVYVVGSYDSLGILYSYVAKWDGISWARLGGSLIFPDESIMAMCLDKNANVYVVCENVDTIPITSYSDSSSHAHVEKWNGTSWSQVDVGVNELNANSHVNTIFVGTLGEIYLAGSFTDGINDTSGNLYVAKWDGLSWSELGTGICPAYHDAVQIFSLLEDTSGNIYASGTFTNGANKCYVAKWDGVSWSELGAGVNALNANSIINSICWDRYGNLYAAGDFTDTTITMTVYPDGDSGTGHPFYVAKWDGNTWSKVGSGTNSLNANDWIMAICSDINGNIYATGNFTDTTVTNWHVDTEMIPSGYYFDTFSYHPYYVAKYTNPLLGIPPVLAASSMLSLFPNPANSLLTISANDDIANLSIANISGQVVYAKDCNLSKIQVDLSGLSAGVYFVRVQLRHGISEQSITRKFVKQ